MRALVRSAAPLALVALLSPPSAAARQDGLEGTRRRSDAEKAEVLLRNRDREMMHPGNPLELIGIDQGDNHFRAKSPLLETNDREPLLVDQEEAYRRRLAMYEVGAKFSEPLRPSPEVAAAAARTQAARPRPPEAATGEGEGGSTLGWLLAFGAMLGLALRWRDRFLS